MGHFNQLCLLTHEFEVPQGCCEILGCVLDCE